MKLNKKGFTLIELLAVVVLLLAISVIAVSSISAAIERNKVKKDNATKTVIVSYGERYANEFKNTFSNCVNVATLKEQYNLDLNTLKDGNGKVFSGSVRYDRASKRYSYSDDRCNSGVVDDEIVWINWDARQFQDVCIATFANKNDVYKEYDSDSLGYPWECLAEDSPPPSSDFAMGTSARGIPYASHYGGKEYYVYIYGVAKPVGLKVNRCTSDNPCLAFEYVPDSLNPGSYVLNTYVTQLTASCMYGTWNGVYCKS